MSSFSSELRKQAKENRMTQVYIADHLKVTTTSVYYWMSDRSVPTIENLARLERLFNLQPGHLMVMLGYQNIDA